MTDDRREGGSGDRPDDCSERRELLGMLRGELAGADVHATRDHLQGCDRCRDELVELAAGHSLLSAAVRTLREPVVVPLPQSPARSAPDVRSTGRRRRLAVAGAAVAAVAVVAVVAVGVGVRGWGPGSGGPGAPAGPTAAPTSPTSPAAPERRADLQPTGRLPGRGEVTMAGTSGRTAEMTVRTRALPRPRPGAYYYVWLLDPRTNKMLPVGQVEAEGSTTFRLPVSLLGRYSAIDVSLETDDGDPGHSPTSVLRAAYAPPSSARS